MSACRLGDDVVCVVRIRHTLVEGADRYIVEGPGVWVPACGSDDDCTIIFTVADPPQKCTFTIRAARGRQLGPPSKPFCVPGSD